MARAGREAAGRFLAEGAQTVREALRYGRVHELFVTESAADRHPDLVAEAPQVSLINRRAAEMLSETVSPQGIVAVCDTVTVPLATAFAGSPRLVAVLVGIADPGNAGTVVRVADAAGADAVVFVGDSVDVHNGKCARASTGSIFHLPIASAQDIHSVLAACARSGLRTVAADGHADKELAAITDSSVPTAWLFGHESRGLSADVLAATDYTVRIPIYGKAESLNLATAAALCLYAESLRHGGRGETNGEHSIP